MFALNWDWERSEAAANLSQRLGNSLCSGIGGTAAAGESLGISWAHRPPGRPTRARPSWRPALLPGDRLCIFNGFLDNAEELNRTLGAASTDPALLYAAAVERWGDEADLHLVGDYCAVLADVTKRTLRLARSPIVSQPLTYAVHETGVAVASVPRAIFAAGVPRTLNEARVVDAAMVNYSDHEASWFEGLRRVPMGSLVELAPGRPRRLVRYYDSDSIRTIAISDAEAIERTQALMAEGVRACLRGFSLPGANLSAGLDSSQVAVHALNALPPGQDLPTFTFTPEAGWDGRTEPAKLGNERPMVEAFAARHPRIRPHFTTNEGIDHDHRWSDFFHVMSGAPCGLRNMYVFHGIFADAAAAGCDVVLAAEWGNNAFSDKGQWAYPEYLRTGRWRQLIRALREIPGEPRPLAWRFIAQAVMPYVSDRLADRIRRMVIGSEHDTFALWQPFTADFRQRSGADARLEAAGFRIGRYQPRSAAHARRLLLRNDDGEGAEVRQAFEQLYGVRERDPLAYRPLVEFCWSLPTRMFVRDGQTRWLAKQTARGIMPEEQRANRLNGRWDSDWHLRVGRRRTEWLAELKRLDAHPRFKGMFDVPRLVAALENYPEQTETDFYKLSVLEFTIPHALLAARFINYVEGRNEA